MSGRTNKTERFLQHLEPLQPALEAYARRSLNDSNAIEDALQNAVANAFRDFHLYVENTNFRAWVFRYLTLEIRNWNRRRWSTASEGSSETATTSSSWETALGESAWSAILDAPEVVLEKCDDEVAAAIEDLPPVEQSILLLRAVGDFKYREIAEVLEIPVGSVMGYLGRARAALRARLADYCRKHRVFRTTTD